jgi:hypothetical protein
MSLLFPSPPIVRVAPMQNILMYSNVRSTSEGRYVAARGTGFSWFKVFSGRQRNDSPRKRDACGRRHQSGGTELSMSK